MPKPERLSKRPFDLAILILAHVILFPLWLLLWTLIPAMIWLDDRGPVFFRQTRLGKGGNKFTVLKFRTMVPDAERLGLPWTTEGDSRLTRVGKVLRRTALDELPQIVNLWRGDISFVGPRTLPIPMHEGYVAEEPAFGQRLQVRPGLTGLAQLSLPRHCSARMRLRYDLLYVRNSNLCLDLKLIVVSVWLTLTGRWGTGMRAPQRRIPTEPPDKESKLA